MGAFDGFHTHGNWGDYVCEICGETRPANKRGQVRCGGFCREVAKVAAQMKPERRKEYIAKRLAEREAWRKTAVEGEPSLAGSRR